MRALSEYVGWLVFAVLGVGVVDSVRGFLAVLFLRGDGSRRVADGLWG